jgi:hypothetical protein
VKIDPLVGSSPKRRSAGLPSLSRHRVRTSDAAQRSDEVHSWKDVVSQRPHQCRLVRDNVSQGDREGLCRVVVGERSADRLGVGFPGGPFLLYAANCTSGLGEEEAGLTRHGNANLDSPVRPNLWRASHAHAGVLVILALVLPMNRVRPP